MNLAIWKKAVADSRLQLLICSVFLVLFGWVFVWLMSQLEIGIFGVLLRMLPGWVAKLTGAPVDAFATRTGQLSILYMHVITLLVVVAWALGRGSDSISGEIGRGTMDLILSLPVRRVTVILAPAVVATLGAAVLAGSILVGIWLGLLTVTLDEEVLLTRFLPGTINLFCMTFCLGGVTTFISSWNRDRWRTIVLSGGFFVVSLIVKLIWRMWPGGDWLKYFTFLAAFQPQALILDPDRTGLLALPYNGTLIVLGLIAYAAGAIVLTYRDIPAAR